MSDELDPADLEAAARDVLLLHGAPDRTGPDDPVRRLAHALKDPDASDLDVTVLVRHLLLRLRLQAGNRIRPVPVAPVLSGRLRTHAADCSLHEPVPDHWFAEIWRPDWLTDGDVDTPDSTAGGPPHTDTSADTGPTAPAADPFFAKFTDHRAYTTPGQRAAARAVIAAPAGSTTIAVLPTGSGKTEVALCLASARKDTVTLLVVPTTALAHDFQRRLRGFYGRNSPTAANADFAWTYSTDTATRERLRNRVLGGTQPVLVTSPESLTRALRETLLAAAAKGRLNALVIDEAHLVRQWGRSFRPEFRTLQTLRADLIAKAHEAGRPMLRTLLLSATLGPAELDDLANLFGEPGPCTLIAANALRAEPRIWIAAAPDLKTREARVHAALAHLPRPAILYTTAPSKAEAFAAGLRTFGYRRIATVTGETDEHHRAEVLAELRTESDAPSRIDLIVATSAFGLGIDYPHVRSVLHACLPETIDRWYQEIGRGGRDGAPSTALLISAPGDEREAESLTTKTLTSGKAHERWNDLWSNRVTVEGRTFLDLHGARGSVGEGDYNWRWNAQLVQGLLELNAVERWTAEPDRVGQPLQADPKPGEHYWVEVQLREDLHGSQFWKHRWEKWRADEWAESEGALRRLRSVLRGEVAFCSAVSQAYRADERARNRFGQAADGLEPLDGCGRCPACRSLAIPPAQDPPPEPVQIWPTDLTTPIRLHQFAAAVGEADGLVVLTADDPASAGRTLCQLLVEAGVRHLSGVHLETPPRAAWIYLDEAPLTPRQLGPVPTLVVLPEGTRFDPTWTSLVVRAASRPDPDQVSDVIVVHSRTVLPTVHGLPLRSTPAHLALTILEGAAWTT